MSRSGSFVITVQVVCGMLLVGLVAYFAIDRLAAGREARLPPGWSTLRPPHDVLCLARVDGNVWAGGKEGLFVFGADGARLAVAEPLRQLRFVAAILAEADGGVWLAHEDGVSHWRNGSIRHFSALAGQFPGRGLALLRDRDGTLWAGAERSLVRLAGEAFQPVAIPESFQLTEAAVLFQDDAGALWIGDSSPRSPGLVRHDATGFRLFTPRDGLPHHAINTIIKERANSRLWIGTGFAGLGAAVILDKGTWRVVGRRDGLAGDKVRSIYEDASGRLWFGSEYEGVAVFGEQRLAVIDESAGLAGPEVKAILEHPQDTFWLGTNGGLTRIARFQPPTGDPRYPGFGRSAAGRSP